MQAAISAALTAGGPLGAAAAGFLLNQVAVIEANRDLKGVL
jgi:hypothetical protein